MMIQDRNIDNAEEATSKMQEINHAFHQIEKQNEEGDDDDGESSGEESEYEREQKEERSRSAKRRAKKREMNEEMAFRQEINEEMARFEKAQRKAERGFYTSESTSFASTSAPEPTNRNKKGVRGKGRSKAARKRAKRNSCLNEKKVSSNDATADTDTAKKSTPFHRLAPEKRCETKFQSKEIIKSPIFTAIHARTYNVLQILTLAMKNPCGRIPLPRGDENDEVFVSPLMIASYLGDFTAADIIIQNADEKWADIVLSTSRPGGYDCLSLAIETQDIATKLYDESKTNLESATAQEDREAQEKIIEQYSQNLEKAQKLVERLTSMKQFAIEKKQKDNNRLVVKVSVTVAGCIFSYRYWGFVWPCLRFFCIKLPIYFCIFIAFLFKPGEVGCLLLAYLVYHFMPVKEEVTPDSSLKETKPPSGIIKDGIDVFCSDGGACSTIGSTCTDGIEDFICTCDRNLKYSCLPIEPTSGIVKDGIDVICSDGETCFTRGSTCTGGIEDLICTCDTDLKYSCSSHTHANAETLKDIAEGIEVKHSEVNPIEIEPTQVCADGEVCHPINSPCTDPDGLICTCGSSRKYVCLSTSETIATKMVFLAVIAGFLMFNKLNSTPRTKTQRQRK